MGSGADVIVLGAGMVGVSVALHLQKRGRDVVLIDRREAGRKRATATPDSIARPPTWRDAGGDGPRAPGVALAGLARRAAG
jgi:glycine/D-amino acid oxidase-like deaminating enzyme